MGWSERSKRDEARRPQWLDGDYPPWSERRKGGGGGFCLLNTMLLIAAPTALIALAVKGARR